MRCKPPIRRFVSLLRSVSSLICAFLVMVSSRRNATSASRREIYFSVQVGACRDRSQLVGTCRSRLSLGFTWLFMGDISRDMSRLDVVRRWLRLNNVVGRGV